MRLKTRLHTLSMTFIVVVHLCQGGDPEEEHPQELLSHDNPQNVIADANLPPEFAILTSSDNPDELNTSPPSSSPKANKHKKTTTCAPDIGEPVDSFMTPVDSGDAPPPPQPNEKTKITTLDPYGLENLWDSSSESSPKKNDYTNTDTDGSNDAKLFSSPVNSGDAQSPKKKTKTTIPDSFGIENASDPPVNIPPKKTQNTASDDSGLNNYLNELKKTKTEQKQYSSSNDELDVQYRSLIGEAPASNDTQLKNEKEDIVKGPKIGDTNGILNPDLRNEIALNPKPQPLGSPKMPKSDLSGFNNDGNSPQLLSNGSQQPSIFEKNPDETKAYGSAYSPNAPKNPAGFPIDGPNKNGISSQPISPKGAQQPGTFGNNNLDTYGNSPNSPRNPVGPQIDGLNKNGISPQQNSPVGAQQPGTFGNNNLDTYGNGPNSPRNPVGPQIDGLNKNGISPQQNSPIGAQQPGTFGNNNLETYGNGPNSPRNPVGSPNALGPGNNPNLLKNPENSPVEGLHPNVNSPQQTISTKSPQLLGTYVNNENMPTNPQVGSSPSESLNTYGKSPQQLPPKSPQSGYLGNNFDEGSAYGNGNSPTAPKSPQLLNSPAGPNQYEKSPPEIPKGAEQLGLLGKSFDGTNSNGNTNGPNSPKIPVGAPVEVINNNYGKSPQQKPKKFAQFLSADQPGTLGNNIDQTYSNNGLESPNNPQLLGSPVDGLNQNGKQPQQLSQNNVQLGTFENNPNKINGPSNAYGSDPHKNPIIDPSLNGVNNYTNSPQQIFSKGAPNPSPLGNSPSGINNVGSSPYGVAGTPSKGTGPGSPGGKNSNDINAISHPINGPLSQPKIGSLQTTTHMPFEDDNPPGPKVVPVGLELKPSEMEKLCALPPLPKGENICYQRNKKNSNTLDTWVKICETIANSMGYCQGLCLYIESPIDTGIYYSVCGISKSNTSDTSDTTAWVYLTTQEVPILMPPDQRCPNNRYKVLHETVSAPRI